MSKHTIIAAVLVVATYVAFTGVSYALFSQSQKTKIVTTPPPVVSNGSIAFDDTLPKTEPCPLNGALYSKQQREWWEKHRPLGVMIENHEDTRPQSGISSADVIYEAVAEGGITRFFGVFYCKDGGQVGPIRSARTYFLDFASEYGDNPLYAHVGGANAAGPADALSQIEQYGWAGYNDLNQFSIGFPTFWRDYDRLGHTTATEHTMYSTTKKLWDYAKTRGLTNVDKDGVAWDKEFVSYSFKDDGSQNERPKGQSIHIAFWSGYSKYFVDWTYNPKTNTYARNNGGVSHIDLDNKKQLSTKNIIVLFMQETNAIDGYENNIHLLYKTKGTGKALAFFDGKKKEATWKKDLRTSRTLLFDTNGTPIKFNSGILWFEILPTDGEVTVK